MPVLRVNDRQHALKPGKTRLGGGAGVDVAVSSDERLGVQAVVEMSEAHVVIQRAGSSAVKVNGVPLGAEPTPLMHGDKVEIAGQELLFSEDAKGGTTRYVTHDDVAGIVQKRTGAARATTGTGGRLVSLVDGKEYVVRPTGTTIGRDASCDIVVAQNEVSRRHAEIVPSDRGYLIHDYSTNGLYVNGDRVQQSRLLARSDIVRVGTEEFRFYADVVPAFGGASVATTAAPPPQPAAPPPIVPPAAPVAAGALSGATGAPPSVSSVVTERVASVPEHVAPGSASDAPTSRPVLATLEIVSEGPSKGKRFEVRVPLAHVGRGVHNDITIDDDSVSDTHAKLQRRDDGWYLVDAGSTNGSYAGASRVMHERRLDGSPDLRFGSVTLSFRPADVPLMAPKPTRAIASMPVDRAKLQREPKTAPAARTNPRQAPAPSSSGLSAWVWLLILVAAAAVAFYLLKS